MGLDNALIFNTCAVTGEAIRQHRSSLASNWFGCASTQRERSSACSAGRPAIMG